MNLRHLMGALTIPCVCIAAEQAIAQDRGVYGPTEPKPTAAAAVPSEDARMPRLPALDEGRDRRITMIESWALDDKAEFGLGRFSVGPIARARTHTERVRDDLMAREDKSVAGAGLRIRFD